MEKPIIESISAVTLCVRDMARSVAFYETAGFPLIYGGTTATFTSFQVGGQFLNLSAESQSIGDAWGRVIFHVADVDALYRHLTAQNLVPEFAPRDAPWGERYFHIVDPDGHEISFARLLS